MNKPLSDRVVAITGATGGIGSEICLALANKGARLLLLGGTKEDKLIKLSNKLSGITKSTFVAGDLTDKNTAVKGIEVGLKEFGKIDILINCAGVATNCPFSEATEEIYNKIMDLNVKAPYFLTQKFLPIIEKSDYPTIINVSSVVGHSGYPNQSIYSASKHALAGWTKALANEVYKKNIRVHLISPGGVYTEMIKITRPDLSNDGMIMPSDVANVVCFLLENRTNAVIDEILLHRVGKEPFLN